MTPIEWMLAGAVVALAVSLGRLRCRVDRVEGYR